MLTGIEESISDATEFSTINTLNYPTNARDPILQSGTYTITYLAGVNGADSLGKDVLELSIIKQSNSENSNGTAAVNVVFAGPLADDERLQESMRTALEDTRAIIQGAGVDLVYNFINAPSLPSTMPDPSAGSSIYEQFPLSIGINLSLIHI